MTRINCIKQYFGTERPVENREIMDLSKEDRQSIGDACADALGIPEVDREWLHEQAAHA